VAGTLRIAHWDSIARETLAWKAWGLDGESLSLPAWRLVIRDEADARTTCSQINFQFANFPGTSIAQWSGTLDGFKDEASHNTMESIAGAEHNAKRFNPDNGLFCAAPNGQAVELWKVRDLDTRIDNLYILAKNNRYAFVRDSRWGVWLALAEFARFVTEKYYVRDVYPMPLSYQEHSGTIWLPARLQPPAILERALVLCSGNIPEVHALSLMLNNEDGTISLSKVEGFKFLSVSSFYNSMADGKWLAYRSIPQMVAERIACKLKSVIHKVN
jgi:hypothetical protein